MNERPPEPQSHAPNVEFPDMNSSPPPHAGFWSWNPDPRHAAAYPPPNMGYPPPYPYWTPPPPWANADDFAHQSNGAGAQQHTQGYGAPAGAGHGNGAGMGGLVAELANGGTGLSSLSKMLDLNDPDFWKGALLGAAAVLVLTNDSVRGALFSTGKPEAGG